MKKMLSIVIPTYNRTSSLQRAIDSTVTTFNHQNFEILVVPNGTNKNWQEVQRHYAQEPRIRWLPISRSHACAARNHGLDNCRGEFVRFLDDDDYLFPEAANQLEEMAALGADISTSPLTTVDLHGKFIRTQMPPATTDFQVAALLSITINNMTAGCIFRRTAIDGQRWHEDVVLYDDYLWILGLAQRREYSWVRNDKPVGAYVEHDGSRLSRTKRSAQNSKPLVAAIIELHRHLASNDRSTAERSHAAATALLTHAHSAFPASPLLLDSTIRTAKAIDPGAIPLQPIFERHPWLARHLLPIEWAALAPRYVTRGYRRASWFVGRMLDRMNS